jgi:CubicO group peptidase (beta-lactamase class C family)
LAAEVVEGGKCAAAVAVGHVGDEVAHGGASDVHYGLTGTAMWISPTQARWAVLLTNKLYYTRDREPLTAVRNAFCTAAFVSSI